MTREEEHSELLHKIDRATAVTKEKVEALERHAAVQNNRLLKVEQRIEGQALEMARTAGAVAFGRWALATIVALMGIGIAVVSVVLTLVVKGV